VESSCEFGIEPSGSMKCWDNSQNKTHIYMAFFLVLVCEILAENVFETFSFALFKALDVAVYVRPKFWLLFVSVTDHIG
jgi:hypothetical protein